MVNRIADFVYEEFKNGFAVTGHVLLVAVNVVLLMDQVEFV